MATIKYYPAMPSDMLIPIDQSGVLLDHSDTSAAFTTRFAGDTIVLTGQGFAYDADTLVGGTASEFVYRAGGFDYLRITNFDWDLAESVPTSAEAFLEGNDIIIGSYVRDYIRAGAGNDHVRGGKGDDVIFSGEGNDILRGGKGSDIFVFALGDGTDRIRDFDTSGPKQDVIRISDVQDISDVSVSQRHHNVVIAFGDDDKIILRHVDLDDLSPKNFDAHRYFDLA